MLTANTNYWGREAQFPNVVIRNMLAPAQLLNVQRGTNEISLDLSPDQAKRLGQQQPEDPGRRRPNIFFLFANSNPKVSDDDLERALPERDPLRPRLQRRSSASPAPAPRRPRA